jgi:formylglycine-generating enzyme required for sulfatase activity
MIAVPAGTFMMGDGVSYCGLDERQVTLTGDLWIARSEVTNQEYIDALQWAYDHGKVTATATTVQDALDGSTVELVDLDSGYCEIAFSGGTFSLLDVGQGLNGNHPVKEVSWYGAAAYCDWLSEIEGLPRAYDHSSWLCGGGDPYGATGYRLPTDAEWEYAAQFDDERTYPWGNEAADPTLANYGSTVGWTTASRTYPGGPNIGGELLYDMGGNVWEWCNDWHTCSLGATPESDPTGPASGANRVLRGGGWGYDASNMRCANRLYESPTTTQDYIGFRCARSQ